MESQSAKAARFLASPNGPSPLLLLSRWGRGAARLFAWPGFKARATGRAATDFLEHGTCGFWEQYPGGLEAARAAWAG